MKDVIEVFDKESNEYKKMEVVTIFNLNNYPLNYIIYREINKSHYYVAKYKEANYSDLDTNLSNDELKLCEEVFKNVLNHNEG